MRAALQRIWRAAPVGFALVGLAVGVQVAVGVVAAVDPNDAHEAHRRVGAVRELVVVGTPEIHGPLELWDGQWWRVLVSPFHHGPLMWVPPSSPAARWHLADLPHLALNAAALLWLGSLLEPRVRRAVYLPFVLLSLPAAFLPEYLLGHAPVGLSGVVCALFGLALVLRTRDPDLAQRMPAESVRCGLAFLVGCIVLTATGVVAVANVAHAAGLAYGAAWGAVLIAAPPRRLLVASSLLAHVLLFPAFWFATHPEWNGRYHWYRAGTADTLPEFRARLSTAVLREPSLEKAWLQLARVDLETGEPARAWETLVEAVHHNRASDSLLEAARGVWWELEPAEQAAARAAVAERFGAEAAAWEERLVPAESVAVGPREPRSAGNRISVPVSPFGPAAFEPLEHREQRAPEVDPDDPDSALLGRPL